MDRRTVLAFALIGLILVLMPYYMQFVQGDRPQTPVELTPSLIEESGPVQADRSRAPEPSEQMDRPQIAQTETPISTDPSHKVSPAPRAEFLVRDVIVDTDLYRAVISTRGGVITSWRLKNYLDLDGNWLELIGHDGAGLGASVAGASLNDIEFVPDREQLGLVGDTRELIIFRGQSAWGSVVKRLEFQGNRYRVEVGVHAEGLTREDRVGITWDGGLADTENQGGISGGFYAGNYEQIVTYLGGEVEIWDIGRLQEDETPPGGQLTWVGVRNKYFLAALIPDEGRYNLTLDGDTQVDPAGLSYYDFSVAMSDDAGRDALKYSAYIGPISYDVLRGQNRDFGGLHRELDLDEFVDYGPSFVRSILKPATILILKAFQAIHSLVPNYGMVIILFSILVKIVVFPLTHKSLESTAKMQTLQPKLAELKERFGKDQQKMNEATMKLYREEKINPIGGCLPMLLQMPILFSLFSVFRGTIDLRQAGFALWIDDLSKPDTLALGAFDLHVLPLLMGVSMFVQQKMMMKDPKQAALVYIMPVFLTYIFWTMSSGLVFYYTLYNVLTLAQQIIMERTKTWLADS